jgi:hypothetical protein
MNTVQTLMETCPKTWEQLEKWFLGSFNPESTDKDLRNFCEMDFDYQVGIFLKFLEYNGVRISVETSGIARAGDEFDNKYRGSIHEGSSVTSKKKQFERWTVGIINFYETAITESFRILEKQW